MNKKVIAIISVLVVIGLLYLGYSTFLAPKGVEGEKKVTVQIVIESQDIDETFTFNTDHEFVTDLLKEHQEKLGAGFQSSEYGTMIVEMMNYTADTSKNEFFLFKVNGEDSMAGTDQTPINDGDTYRFELSKW
jgi:hypothetical protein